MEFFFNGWSGPLRTLVVGAFAYVMLIIFLRLSGKRTLSKMSAFDFVVTVALGSTLASIALMRDVSLVQGAVALSVLIGLQYLVTWSSVRTRWVRRLVTGEPSLLLFRGELLTASMRKTRVSEHEVRAAIRAAGLLSFADAEAVVLETDASFSVIRRIADPGSAQIPSLSDVKSAAGW
jgi:uncharacterized membrane protein YcaP (DUF421 family)